MLALLLAKVRNTLGMGSITSRLAFLEAVPASKFSAFSMQPPLWVAGNAPSTANQMYTVHTVAVVPGAPPEEPALAPGTWKRGISQAFYCKDLKVDEGHEQNFALLYRRCSNQPGVQLVKSGWHPQSWEHGPRPKLVSAICKP